MQDNPLIVFAIPETLGKRREALPIGWRMDGTVDSPVLSAREAFAILLLDDTLQTPDISFTNRYSQKPLLIIAHKSSELHNRSSILNDLVLKSWGAPYVCGSFSHGEGETWEDIKSLMAGNPPAAFAERWRTNHDLELYDQLAAICQIGMLDPSLDTEVHKTINQLPQQFREASRRIWNSEQVDWVELLKITRDYAAMLSQ